jgi:catalase (peroxidase I)
LGALIRLPFHDASGGGGRGLGAPGGPNGCIDSSTTDNAGLFDIIAQLDAVRAPYASIISRADFWVLAGNTAVKMATTIDASFPASAGAAAGMDNKSGAAGPLILPFLPGRVDLANCTGVDAAQLPDPSYTWPDLQSLFGGRFGMNDTEIVAIMGAHAIGRMSTDDSAPVTAVWAGFASSFANTYFQKLINIGWKVSATSGNVWLGGGLAFLRPDVELGVSTTGTTGCPVFNILANRLTGCPFTGGFSYAQLFANDQSAWFRVFSTAWQKLTSLYYVPDPSGAFLVPVPV